MPQHVYFDDDDPQPVASTSAPAATQFARCCSSARVDYDFSDPCYVFKVVRSHDGSRLAATLSNNTIKTYSVHGEALSHAGDVLAHSKTITDATFPLADAPHALYSCSADGSVRAWDLRTSQQAESYEARQELFCFDVLGDMVVAGGQGDVVFWDRRTRKVLATFDDMHMDDVTQARFHAASRGLITASTDGLVAVHDTANGLNQDDGFIAALNAGTSVEELGLYGPQQERLWLRTGTESLQLWEWAKAAAPDASGGDVAFLDLTWEARIGAAEAAARGGGEVASIFQEVDYLAGCHWDAASGQLLLIAGTNAGAVGFWPVAEAAAISGALAGTRPADALAAPPVVLRGAHADVVRSVRCFASDAAAAGAGGLLCATGGEDSKLALWTLAPPPPAAGGNAAAGAAGGAGDASDGSASSGPARHKQGGRRAAPY